MQRTADFHDPVADARLPEAAGVMDSVMDHAAALDAAVDVLNAHAAAGDAPIGGFLAAGEGSASGLAGRHDDLHLVQRECLEAQILEQPTARGSRIGGGIRNALIMDTTRGGLTQEENRQHGIDQQYMFDRVALVLAAITARLLRRILGTPDASFGPIRRNRGEAGDGAGDWAGAAADALGSSCPDPTKALTSASVTPRRFASSIKDRLGVSPSVRSVAWRTTNRTWIH
jgi:hypothetical protein